MTTYDNHAAERLIRVLESVGEAGRPVTVSEIARATGYNRGTVFRILAVLHAHAYVHKNPRAKTYMLGHKMFHLGQAETRDATLREHARPFIRRLAFDVGMTTHLTTIEGPQVIYLDKVEPPGGVAVFTYVGMRLDAHATAVGKALLAFRAEEEVAEIYRYHSLHQHTPRTVHTLPELMSALREVRRRGFATENGEAVAGVACVAAPVFETPGRAHLALSLSGTLAQVPAERVASLARKVQATAAELRDYIARRELPDPRIAQPETV